MFQYRQALVRMRQGDSDRQIAAARIMGRRTAARLRELGAQRNWLDATAAMPEDDAIAAALGQPKRASTTVSSLAAQRERLQSWAGQGVSGVAIFAALQREQGWSGSYSAVRRILADIRSAEPPQTSCRLDFCPGEAVQVDFGAGPMLMHPDDKLRRTWAFVMTLCLITGCTPRHLRWWAKCCGCVPPTVRWLCMTTSATSPPTAEGSNRVNAKPCATTCHPRRKPSLPVTGSG